LFEGGALYKIFCLQAITRNILNKIEHESTELQEKKGLRLVKDFNLETEGGKGGGGYGSRFTTRKKAVSRFTCLEKAISRKTRF
jgi:hypothetical protein